MRELTGEVLVELHLYRLVLVVLETLGSTAVEALLAVEQIGGLVPHIAQFVNVEGELLLIFLHYECTTVGSGVANLGETYAGIFQELLQLELMLVRYLDDDTRILGKQVLDDVAASQVVKVDMHTSTGIGEAHLQQGGDHTACRDVMTSQNPAATNHFLNSFEAVGEILGVLHGRYITAHLT